MNLKSISFEHNYCNIIVNKWNKSLCKMKVELFHKVLEQLEGLLFLVGRQSDARNVKTKSIFLFLFFFTCIQLKRWMTKKYTVRLKILIFSFYYSYLIRGQVIIVNSTIQTEMKFFAIISSQLWLYFRLLCSVHYFWNKNMPTRRLLCCC